MTDRKARATGVGGEVSATWLKEEKNMSRVGKMPIALQGVEVKMADVRSPSRARWAPDAADEPLVKVANNDGTLSSRRSTKAAKPTPCPARCARWSQHGHGVTKGFERKLTWLAWVTVPRRKATS
jgi:hypothetical protein